MYLEYIIELRTLVPTYKGQLQSQGWKPWEITNEINKRFTVEMIALSKKDDSEIVAILEKDAEMRMNRIIEDTKKITGEVIDAELEQVESGQFNGFIRGTNGVAKVTTFYAGGYNIQPLHFRTKITKVQ